MKPVDAVHRGQQIGDGQIGTDCIDPEIQRVHLEWQLKISC